MQQRCGTHTFTVADGLVILTFLAGEVMGELPADENAVRERDRLGLEDRSRLTEVILRRSRTVRCGNLGKGGLEGEREQERRYDSTRNANTGRPDRRHYHVYRISWRSSKNGHTSLQEAEAQAGAWDWKGGSMSLAIECPKEGRGL